MRLAMLVLLETNQMSPSSHSLITFSKLVLGHLYYHLGRFSWSLTKKVKTARFGNRQQFLRRLLQSAKKNTNAHIALLDCLSHKAMQNGGSRRSNSFFLLLTLQTWNVTISKMSIESAGKALLYYLGLPEF